MAKLIGIVGMPGTGKTTLMREWMSKREWTPDTPIQLLDSYHSDNIRLFGKYELNETFAGTDKLSMAVMPVAIQYMQNPTHDVNIFEGDRLTSVNFFTQCRDMGHDVSIVVLEVSDAVREQRYKDRGSEQSDTFIQGRRTKINNIMEEFGDKPLTGEDALYKSFIHETPEDTKVIISHIEQLIA